MIDIQSLLKSSPVSTIEDFQLLLQEIFTSRFDPEYLFYFEREDLLTEVRFVFGNEAARKLNSNQYFYQFKDMAFQFLGKPAQIINDIYPEHPRNSFRSAIFFPIDLTLNTKGMFVLGNPSGPNQFTLEDLAYVEQVFETLQTQIENIKLRYSIETYEKEVALIDKITYIIDMSTMAGFFFNCLTQVCEEAIDCQIVIFLMFDPDKGVYSLEAGNSAGCEFWVGQTEFFRSLAKQAEERGTFTETYGGKYFKGEKYGLEKLETALVVPVNFYQQSSGVFIFLNKNGQKNFSGFDIRLIRLIAGYSKAVIYRELEKKKLASLFKRFVSERIGDQILHNEDYNLELEGRQRITSLFIDLNGFTTFTENTDATIVTRQLNTYFQEMTNLILEYEGTLDKYLGDGIMAIFGSPIELANHAERAVECALAMQTRMSEITQLWIEEGLHPLTASIGIYTGEALVGAIGCEQFLDYTAIGDTINVSSRLCGVAKHGTILIGQSTWEEMQDVLYCEPLSELKLKGKMHSIQCYEVQGLKDIYDIRDMLSTAETDQKIRILHSLGNFFAYNDSDIILDHLRSEDPTIRTATVESIGKLNKERHLSVIINHMEKEEDPVIRTKIQEIISNITSDPIEPLIDKYIKGVAPGVRPTILKATIHSPNRDDKRLFLALVKGLQDPQESQSSMSADLTHLLYQVEDIPIMKHLIDTLPHAKPAVKCSIINTFGKIEVPQIAAPLVKILTTESEPAVLMATAKAIGNISNEKTLKILATLFTESNELRHWHQYICCRQSKTPAQYYPALLETEDIALHYATLIMIRKDRAHGMEEQLISMLLSTYDTMLQIRIMECLRTAPDEKVMPVYLSLLNRDEELDSQIVSEIGARNYTDSLAVVHEAMKSENPSLKMQAILASGRMSHPDSLEHLLAILQEKDNANITATVIRMLGNFKSDKVLLTLLEGLSSPIGRIRANAIESLLSLNQTSTVNQIERLLQDDNNRVRANAALACLRFGRIQNLSVLADMARSNNKWMRLSCLWALSVTGMPEAREIMLGLLRDPDYDVLLSAVNFLKRIDAANR